MQYKKIECPNYDIHLIKNNSFHTINFKVYFTSNVSKENITYYNFLVSILTSATKVYDTKEKLMKKCQDLYSLSPIASLNRNGNLLTCKFGISTVNSKYIEKDHLQDNLLLLKEILFNPLVENNMFNEKYFNIIKQELINETKTIPEEPRLLANIKLLELINRGENNIMTSYCDMEVLNKIDRSNLYQKYLELINNSKIDIFISGNIKETNKLIDFIKDNFTFTNKVSIKEGIIIHKPSELLVKEECGNYQQSKLSIGYKFYNLTDYENRYVGFVFNNIIGGGTNSLLMRYIREEKSLCYYINSYYNRLDNVLIINSGINKKNYEEVLKSQEEVFEKVINGEFSEEDIKEAKEELLFELSNVYEKNSSIIEYYYGRSIFNSDDLDTKIKMINKVSREDIMKLAKKVEINGVFFLKGDL